MSESGSSLAESERSYSSGEETSTSSDEEIIDVQVEKDFLKTLSLLKGKDPKIYDTNYKFFKELDSKNKDISAGSSKSKREDNPIFLKDFERNIITERGGKYSDEEEIPKKENTYDEVEREIKDGFQRALDDDDNTDDKEVIPKIENTYDEVQRQIKDGFKRALDDDNTDDKKTIPKIENTYVEVQRQIKDGFKRALDDDDNNIDDEKECAFGGILKKRQKTQTEEEKEEEDYILWLKGQNKDLLDKGEESDLKTLHNYWNSSDLGEKEEFLKDFILNKRFVEKDENDCYVSDESILSEDGRALNAQEEFENKYNNRFDEPSELLKRYPRNVEGSLRRKDDRRTKKRLEIREKKHVEKLKKREKVKEAQKKKMLEIEEKLEELKKIVGNDELAFSKEDILDDFDPNKFDKKMNEVYNDDFYAGIEDSKPQFSGSLDEEDWGSVEDNDAPIAEENCLHDLEEMNNDQDFNMDCEAHLYEKKTKKATRTRKKKNLKNNSFNELCSKIKPVYDPTVHKSFQKYMDEFYGLDCEDFIEDIPCRFKYRNVEPNNYGLSVEEILMADDKELNRWSSLKKIFLKRPTHIEKNEFKQYQTKARNENLKQKILPSLYQTEDDVDVPTDKTGGTGEHSNSTSNTTSSNPPKSKEENYNHKKHLPNKVKRNFLHFKNKNRNSSKGGGFSDSRLRAYGLKPKKFRRKLDRNLV